MYKCPLAGGCLLEVNSGGSCLCMVNREHFWKVMVAGEARGGRGEDWTAVTIPTSLCWLRANARSSLCIYFSSAFQHCVHLVFEAAQRHIWCDRCTQHMSSRGHELKCLTQWITLSVKLTGGKHEFLMTSKKKAHGEIRSYSLQQFCIFCKNKVCRSVC